MLGVSITIKDKKITNFMRFFATLQVIIMLSMFKVATMYRPVSQTFVFTRKRILGKPSGNKHILSMSTEFSSVSSMSSQLKTMRNSFMMDEKTRLMIDALRGKNLNNDESQGKNIDMKVVEISSSNDKDDILPLVYDPIKLERYFSRRPKAVFTRIWQIMSTSTSFLSGLLFDYLRGNIEDVEVRRAAELRNTIVSLGPFFIKAGQALSIRPDVLSPRAMVELQQLCDKVPCFDNNLAMRTIEEELKQPVNQVFSEVSPEPVAAASLGQVYRAKLLKTGEEVAVKVQRPFVLETVSLDLYLVRKLGQFLRKFPKFSQKLDIISLLDEFANNFYQELDYNVECQNGIRIKEEMKKLPRVLIPKPYPEYTSRRVHTAEWISGEKLSQSKAEDVNALVNLGVITYLTQLLDTGFFHADPHPGNMLRSPDGKLVILDFGLMTKITDDQKYGMMEAIAHLIHRDYDQIGNDFVNLDFIPRGTDTTPIVPALTRVFEAALSGGGAKSINFQELAADLAEITFKFPFRIPPYFALIIRAISVLEGIALVGNPEFAIVDEAYPFISKRLLTDPSPRARQAFRYMIYGKGDTLDTERMIDMLQALEKFIAVKNFGTGSTLQMINNDGKASGPNTNDKKAKLQVREALKFFFSEDGVLLREFAIDEIVRGVDALSRDALRELFSRLTLLSTPLNPWRMRLPAFVETIAPTLSEKDRKVVDSVVKLVAFFSGNKNSGWEAALLDSSGESTYSSKLLKSFMFDGSQQQDQEKNSASVLFNNVVRTVQDKERREMLQALLPTLQEYAPSMREFGRILIRRLWIIGSKRLLNASLDLIFGPEEEKAAYGT